MGVTISHTADVRNNSLNGICISYLLKPRSTVWCVTTVVNYQALQLNYHTSYETAIPTFTIDSDCCIQPASLSDWKKTVHWYSPASLSSLLTMPLSGRPHTLKPRTPILLVHVLHDLSDILTSITAVNTIYRGPVQCNVEAACMFTMFMHLLIYLPPLYP